MPFYRTRRFYPDMNEKKNTVVIAAHADGHILPETWDLAAFAQQLAGGRTEAIEIYVVGENIGPMAEEIAEQTGLDVRAVSCAGLRYFSSEVYCRVMGQMLSNKGVLYIIAAHNSQGQEYAPALAVMLNAGCISGVNGLRFDDGAVLFQRDVHGGKARANMISHAETTVLTVQPGVFRPDAARRAAPGRVSRQEAEYTPGRTRVSGIQKARADAAGIAEAKVVVAAGRGIGEEENMPLMESLAEMFPRSAVAGTRIVCDRGWLPYSRQVGVTGATVAPALYIACGISGASQHVMGMRGAKFVVAINTDPQAAMFNESDVCIVEDVTTFVPLLLDVFRQQQNDNPVPTAPDNEESGG